MSLDALAYQGFHKTPYHTPGDVSEFACANLVEELPVCLNVQGIAHAVIMATPIQVEEFAIGFAVSESIIESIKDIRDIQIEEQRLANGINALDINLQISPRRFNEYKHTRKVHLGASGCGLCGKETLEQVFPDLPKLPQSTFTDISSLDDLRDKVFSAQHLGQRTGALHAALLLDPQGDILCCMEDIGRHNCLDKVIGFATKSRINLHQHSVVMSSRCSTELILKAVKARLSTLIHLASPSHLAVNLAQEYGLTLIHLPKQDAPRFFTPVTIKDKIDER